MNKIEIKKQGREHLESLDHKSFTSSIQFRNAVEEYWIGQMVKLEKAFGGCTKCYGKAYSTEQVGATTAHADFDGEDKIIKGPHLKMNFCSCERGKALKKLLKK